MLEPYLEILGEKATLFPLLLTAKVILVSGGMLLVFGVVLGYYLSRAHSPFRGLLDFLVTMPLVFPPIATGFALLLFLGRDGPIGRALGIELVFNFQGVALASFVAGLPLMVKPVEAAFRGCAKQLSETAYVLGKSEWQTFYLVLLPNVRRSIVAGWFLAIGRSVGEVGITLMLGGNVVGKTNTLSLEIFNSVFSGEFDRAIVLTCLIGMISMAIYLVLRRFSAV
jgi:molybdate transport system permease protein